MQRPSRRKTTSRPSTPAQERLGRPPPRKTTFRSSTPAQDNVSVIHPQRPAGGCGEERPRSPHRTASPSAFTPRSLNTRTQRIPRLARASRPGRLRSRRSAARLDAVVVLARGRLRAARLVELLLERLARRFVFGGAELAHERVDLRRLLIELPLE